MLSKEPMMAARRRSRTTGSCQLIGMAADVGSELGVWVALSLSTVEMSVSVLFEVCGSVVGCVKLDNRVVSTQLLFLKANSDK